MPRALRLATLWIVVTGIATLVSWFGVRSVVDASLNREAPLTSAEVRRVATQPPAPGHPPGTPRINLAPASPDDWQAVPDGNGGYQILRSFRLRGGTASVRFGARDVQLIAATAAQGFTVDVVRQADDHVVIRFQSRRHVSQVDAYWAEGGPRARLAEAAP